MKGTKELHLMIQTPLLFCLCPDSGFFEQPANKKNLHGSKKHDGAKNFLIEFGKVPQTTVEAASGSGNLARSKSINEL